MPGSKTELCNLAFRLLGGSRIDSMTEQSPNGQLARDTYDLYLDRFLSSHPWNFAVQQAALSADGTTPEWEFDYAYTLPAGDGDNDDDGRCLRVLSANTDFDWKQKGRQIHTDAEAPLQIEFIARETNITKYDPEFVQAFASYLAQQWALSQTELNSGRRNKTHARTRVPEHGGDCRPGGQLGPHQRRADRHRPGDRVLDLDRRREVARWPASRASRTTSRPGNFPPASMAV